MRVVDDASLAALRRSNLCCPMSLVAISSSTGALTLFSVSLVYSCLIWLRRRRLSSTVPILKRLLYRPV